MLAYYDILIHIFKIDEVSDHLSESNDILAYGTSNLIFLPCPVSAGSTNWAFFTASRKFSMVSRIGYNSRQKFSGALHFAAVDLSTFVFSHILGKC